ncbi:WAT1-related protein [Acorus gramineus]|uniref:WAT1-related protein n=1 Tax=Acorus gramineus TaxID=55184 RepID=A0AAV9BSL1_ACOGR|nr:WAT1-related protein [Acorus gramineus]
MKSGDLAPTFAMVVVQVGFAGLNVVSKLAMDSGMNPFVMVSYRQVIATVFLGPVAYFLERKSRLEITRSILFQIFLCSIFGATLNQLLYFLGLKYSTPTIACALSNILPAITFVMAVPFKIETVGIKRISGQAKVVGTILCVGGAMFMTFYKGEQINIGSSGIHWRSAERMENTNSSNEDENMILGSILVVASCFAWAIWFIIQAKMSKTFASPYTSSAIMCFMGSIECVIIGGCIVRDISEWAVGLNIRLVAALYTGVVGSGIAFSLMSWCIQRRGPLYVSMFSPLLLIIVAVLGWTILDEKLYVGSAVGSALIIIGLYSVLWGKGREMEEVGNVGGKTLEEHGKGTAIGGLELPKYSVAVLDPKMKPLQSEGDAAIKMPEVDKERSGMHSIDCSCFGLLKKNGK